MPLKVSFPRKCHTEKRRGRRIIKTKQWKSRRHRRCIERRSLFAISISNLYTKRLSRKTSQDSVRYASVALCAVGTSVTLHNLRPLHDSVCLLYKTFSLSLQISEEPILRWHFYSENSYIYPNVRMSLQTRNSDFSSSLS